MADITGAHDTTEAINAVRCVGRTDQGRVRDNNEDYFEYDTDLSVAVLADGMGGLNAGEVASETAVVTVLDAVRKCLQGPKADGRAAEAVLEAAIVKANRVVYELAEARYDYQGMGTTLVVVQLLADAAVIAHVGDSRVYHFSKGALALVTEDHSLVQQLVNDGVLTDDQARRAPNRNIVTRAIGIEANVSCDVVRVPVQTGDLFVLCSDGLTDMVEDADLAKLIAKHADDQERLVDELMAAALAAGGVDNVSVVAVVV